MRAPRRLNRSYVGTQWTGGARPWSWRWVIASPINLLPLAAAPRLADLNLVAQLARDPPALVKREAAVVGRRDRLLDGPLHRLFTAGGVKRRSSRLVGARPARLARSPAPTMLVTSAAISASERRGVYSLKRSALRA